MDQPKPNPSKPQHDEHQGSGQNQESKQSHENKPSQQTKTLLRTDEPDWHCIICGESLGPHNPRQYCRKSYCPMDDGETFYKGENPSYS